MSEEQRQPAGPDPDALAQQAGRLAERVALLGEYLDPNVLETRVAELEVEMGAGDFWDDQARAAKVSAEHARLSGRLTEYHALAGDVGDLGELAAMAREEERAGSLTPEFVTEVVDGLDRAENRLFVLEESRLFGGEHDAGDAVVTIQSGEGGTDAQDWAEMLLRMYLRWAETRGMTATVQDRLDGGEAGIKSATFTLAGTNAYGLMSAERGVHRLVRLSPFDSANRRQTSFAAVQVAPLVTDEAVIEIDDKARFLKKGARVVDLGAAPGGWSQVAAKRVHAPAQCSARTSAARRRTVRLP